MVQRVNLNVTGLPVRKKTFIAKTLAIAIIQGLRRVFTFNDKRHTFALDDSRRTFTFTNNKRHIFTVG